MEEKLTGNGKDLNFSNPHLQMPEIANSFERQMSYAVFTDQVVKYL